MSPDTDPNIGVDGGIANFIEDIAQSAAASNGFVLEIGVATGMGSTIAIQRGLAKHPHALHISVDQRDYMTRKPDVDWWHLIIGDDRLVSTRDLVCAVAGKWRPGLIFIDTDHDYEQMRAELAIWSSLAVDETVWLFHDTWMFSIFNEPMVRAIQEFAAASGGRWVYEDWRQEPHGLGRMRHA